MNTSLIFASKVKNRVLALFLVIFFFNLSAFAPAPPAKDQSIQLALLLDTSNSMDGLIDQAKSQLWKIVNELAAAKCADGKKPNIKIALYEYGNDGLPSSEGYIRLVSGLTDDLDLISEKLFALSTNGGNEYCGQVINTSLKQLEWSTSANDLKMIFIAGNEPFTQGRISYRTASALAREKGVVVNTIFCGPYEEGVSTSWKDGADITGGSYMSIEQNRRTVYVPSPYDDRISALNEKLNNTYVYYGSSGASKKELQAIQDSNAGSYGEANKVERAVSKSSHAYKNSSWDLVDAAKENEEVVASAKEEDLPKEMKGMTTAQRQAYVKEKAAERKKIQDEIQTLSKKRQEYIMANTPKAESDKMLDAVMIKAVREKAKTKNLSF
ncbi:MAG: VWA domain-containing protein [Bacteroidetes bacterium CHB5]|nr:VWA domain-containing protein [Bacteroidetes bacterium CHB5]